MDLKCIMAATLISLAGLSASGIAGVDRSFIERSVEELKLMTEPELAGEARIVCIDIMSFRRLAKMYIEGGISHQAPEYSEMGRRGRPYLARIGLVVRDRHHGHMPVWFDQIGQALQGQDELACDKAATAGGWHK
jgi:hypothetical protein